MPLLQRVLSFVAEFVVAAFPGMARVVAVAAVVAAAFLFGRVWERHQIFVQAAEDAERWPWVVGTWSLDREAR